MKRKIIACLDIKDGKVVKGTNFVDLETVGDPVELAIKYQNEGADELVFLDISATLENRKTVKSLVSDVAKQLKIPLTVGGGISSVEDAEALIKAGANKISIGSAAVRNPEFITDLANKIGSAAVTVAIDYKTSDAGSEVYVKGGTENTGINLFEWVKETERLGAGEILLTSMNHDGMKTGFDIDVLNKVTQLVQLPIVASGGAGSIDDFKSLFTQTTVEAGLGAGVFHFGIINLSELKKEVEEWN